MDSDFLNNTCKIGQASRSCKSLKYNSSSEIFYCAKLTPVKEYIDKQTASFPSIWIAKGDYCDGIKT